MGWRGPVRSPLAWAPVCLMLSACVGSFAPAATLGVDVPLAPFSECQPPYAYVGRTTLAALGIAQGGLDRNRVGRVWITANVVTVDEFAPPEAPGGPAGSAAQVMCIEFADGSGMSSMLTEPFSRPGQLEATTAPGDASNLRLVLVAVSAVALTAISVLAFRAGDRHAS